jgi:hypothetical protein
LQEGKKRKLIINGAKLEDAGKITVKSNADQASADLGVKCEKLVSVTFFYARLSWVWFGWLC